MFTIGLFNEDHRLCYIDDSLIIAVINEGPAVFPRNGNIPQGRLNYALSLTKLQLKKGGEWLKDQNDLSFHLLEEQESEVQDGSTNARGNNSTKARGTGGALLRRYVE